MNFSIVIPLYNKASFVCETLQSLIHQETLPYEIIIVDDCSTDDSLKKTKEFLSSAPLNFNSVKLEIVELKENKGPGYARNIGFSKATGDVVSFMDADDLYVPGLLKKANELMTDKQVDFLVVGIQLFPSMNELPKLNKIDRFLSKIDSETYVLDQPLETVTLPDFFMGRGSNVFVKREWMSSTKYHEGAALNEGVDYWYRVLKVVLSQDKPTVALLMGNYLHVREVEGSLSRIKYKSWREIHAPPMLLRYKESKDLYDLLMTGMISERWIRHSMQSLSSRSQKILFKINYRSIYWKQRAYLRLRKNHSN